MELKRVYSESEVNELIEWFAQRKDRLPETMQLNKATYLEDVARTVNAFCTLARESRKKSTFSAQLKILFDIREKLENDNLIKPE